MGVQRDALLRFTKGATEKPPPATLAAMATWARVHAAPPPQTRGPGLRPSDYALNLYLHSAQQLCGVPLARLQDFTRLLSLGELNRNTSGLVQGGLTRVLEEMDEEDTRWVVEICSLSGDLSLAYDGFHSQNRNARTGMGNFTSKLLGLVVNLKTLDKHTTEGVAGISQRLEKVGLVLGTIELIVKQGFLVPDICTDQCKGAPSDLAKVSCLPSPPQGQLSTAYLLCSRPPRYWSARTCGKCSCTPRRVFGSGGPSCSAPAAWCGARRGRRGRRAWRRCTPRSRRWRTWSTAS